MCQNFTCIITFFLTMTPLNRNYFYGFKLSHIANIKASNIQQVIKLLKIQLSNDQFQILNFPNLSNENIYQLTEMVSIELTGDWIALPRMWNDCNWCILNSEILNKDIIYNKYHISSIENNYYFLKEFLIVTLNSLYHLLLPNFFLCHFYEFIFESLFFPCN